MRWLARLHRSLGVLAALFVLILAVTGLLLNHTDTLRLHEIPLGSSALRAWYGIEAPPVGDGYQVDDVFVAQLGGNLYLDAKRINQAPGELMGATAHDGVLVVGFTESVMLFTPDGRLIERITPDAPPTRVGRASNGRAVLDSAAGLLQANADLTEWQSATNLSVVWSVPRATPEDIANHIAADYLEIALNWERVLLDLHSGRLFGAEGELVMDLAALCLIFMAASGIWLFFRRQRTNGW
ncbi:MAG: PepSY-associated TM helix domain-containing protein [Pseudomonadales bacterium]